MQNLSVVIVLFKCSSYGSTLCVNFSGESAVGKSSLVLRFVKGQFHEYQESTIGGTCVLSLQLKVCFLLHVILESTPASQLHY